MVAIMLNVRNFIVLFLICLLPACGFTPLYSKTGNHDVQSSFDQIYIGNIPNREGQYLRNQLMDQLYQQGRPSNAKYELSIEPIRIRKTDLDITKSADATRGQLRLQSLMKLKERETGKVIMERHLQAITSYNILQSQFTTRVSEENARENALNDLARQIENYLALYFKNPN